VYDMHDARFDEVVDVQAHEIKEQLRLAHAARKVGLRVLQRASMGASCS